MSLDIADIFLCNFSKETTKIGLTFKSAFERWFCSTSILALMLLGSEIEDICIRFQKRDVFLMYTLALTVPPTFETVCPCADLMFPLKDKVPAHIFFTLTSLSPLCSCWNDHCGPSLSFFGHDRVACLPMCRLWFLKEVASAQDTKYPNVDILTLFLYNKRTFTAAWKATGSKLCIAFCHEGGTFSINI